MSRPDARERDLLAQARREGAAPFVKQLGAVWQHEAGLGVGKGGDIATWPEDLRIREFPRGAVHV